MKLSAALLPGDWYWIAHGVLAAVAAWVFRTAPWARLRDNAQNHLFLGSVVSLLVLWSIRPPLLRGIEFHFLGATALTLMFGPQLAIAALGLVVAGLALAGHSEWAAYSINVLVLAVLPTFASRGVHMVSDRVLPQNIFVFIFVPAFLGGAIALALSGGTAVGLVAAFGDPLTAGMAEQFLPYCLLLSFAEATLTGMVITLMVVYRPTWVGTFDDGRYLRKQ